MPRRRNSSYESTSVSVGRSREQIDEMLRSWGVSGIQWEDDFDKGVCHLRFRWKGDGEEGGTQETVARFRIDMKSETELRELAVDGRSGKFSEKKYKRVKADRGKREHRLIFNLLKNMIESIEEGILPARSLLLPWIEDGEGVTVFERLSPYMDSISSGGNVMSLGPGKGGGRDIEKEIENTEDE